MLPLLCVTISLVAAGVSLAAAVSARSAARDARNRLRETAHWAKQVRDVRAGALLTPPPGADAELTRSAPGA
jgi:hypothetical protein